MIWHGKASRVRGHTGGGLMEPHQTADDLRLGGARCNTAGPGKRTRVLGRQPTRDSRKIHFQSTILRMCHRLSWFQKRQVPRTKMLALCNRFRRWLRQHAKQRPKTRKAQQELADGRSHWAAYQDEMKKAFQSEQKRHLADVARLEALIQESKAEEIATKKMLQPTQLSSFEDVVMNVEPEHLHGSKDLFDLLSEAGVQSPLAVEQETLKIGKDIRTPVRLVRQLPSTPLGARIPEHGHGQKCNAMPSQTQTGDTPVQAAATFDPYLTPGEHMQAACGPTPRPLTRTIRKHVSKSPESAPEGSRKDPAAHNSAQSFLGGQARGKKAKQEAKQQTAAELPATEATSGNVGGAPAISAISAGGTGSAGNETCPSQMGPAAHVIYDVEDRLSEQEEEISDLEAWYNSHVGDKGLQHME